jgi:hypothetical protein
VFKRCSCAAGAQRGRFIVVVGTGDSRENEMSRFSRNLAFPYRQSFAGFAVVALLRAMIAVMIRRLVHSDHE